MTSRGNEGKAVRVFLFALYFLSLPFGCLPSFLPEHVCLSACFSVCLPDTCLRPCLPVCLSVCLYICQPTCLFVCLVGCLWAVEWTGYVFFFFLPKTRCAFRVHLRRHTGVRRVDVSRIGLKFCQPDSRGIRGSSSHVGQTAQVTRPQHGSLGRGRPNGSRSGKEAFPRPRAETCGSSCAPRPGARRPWLCLLLHQARLGRDGSPSGRRGALWIPLLSSSSRIKSR